MSNKELTTKQIEAKRAREKTVVLHMIEAYCHGKHGTRRDELCTECTQLAEYAEARISRCPFMATKTFCSQCHVHCYTPEKLQAIKDVMRYAGPRMLLRHPVLVVRHGLDGMKKR